MKPVRFLEPSFPAAEDVAADYAAILERGIFSNSGPLEREFAAAIALWVGNDVRATPVSNCTAGLELAVQATFHRDRPLALVPSFTFVAGPLSLRNNGFSPVFVDVDPVSWQPDPDQAADFLAAHHRQVGGILLAATFGVADAAVHRWQELADRYGLPLVIDSAAGFGAERTDGEPLGSRGTCEVFSLHATKTLAIGEGGVITSRDHDLIDQLERMKNFGFNKEHLSVGGGTNAKLSELSAAIGLRQLRVLPSRLVRRRSHLRRYIDALTPLGVSFQPGAERSAPAFVSALLPTPAARDAIASALRNSGVECREYYNPPVHRQPVFADATCYRELVVTEDLCRRMLSLPMADNLDAEVVERVAEIARSVLGG